MSEYRWTWGTQDRIGIWVSGGTDPNRSLSPAIRVIRSIRNSNPGWWCYIMEIPKVLPPKQQMTSVLWVRIPDQMDFEKFTTEAVWAKQGETLLSTEKSTWVPTNVMRSYER